jgi:hypothetical protein
MPALTSKQDSGHCLGERLVVRARSVLGGLHHDYFLAEPCASRFFCGAQPAFLFLDRIAIMARRPITIPAPGVRIRRGLRWIEQHAQAAFDDVRGKRGRMHGASSSDVAAALAWLRETRKTGS